MFDRHCAPVSVKPHPHGHTKGFWQETNKPCRRIRMEDLAAILSDIVQILKMVEMSYGGISLEHQWRTGILWATFSLKSTDIPMGALWAFTLTGVLEMYKLCLMNGYKPEICGNRLRIICASNVVLNTKTLKYQKLWLKVFLWSKSVPFAGWMCIKKPISCNVRTQWWYCICTSLYDGSKNKLT